MPSIMRSLPVPRYSSTSSEHHVPGKIVDVDHSQQRRFSSVQRRSTEFSIASSRSSKSSQESLTSAAGSIDIQIESPPLVCYGPANESSGALLGGQLWLNVSPWETELDSLKMGLQVTISTKRPVVINCADCTSKTTDLNTWEFISGVHSLSHGQHNYPFSFLIPGNTPATTESDLGSIKYKLVARGTTINGEVISASQDIKISRSILEGEDRNSLRIFPPTNMSAALVLPSVIHRGGTFPVEMRLDGVVHKENNTRWRLKKVSWRIEEKAKIISPACKKHAPKIGGEGKGVQYEEVKILGANEAKTGWKTDFETGDGRIEFQFTAGIPAGTGSTDDVDNANGLSVSHILVLELIVAEEYVPKNTKMITPTGSARVLRMQFGMTTTARSGMGISWEDECPPRYDDIPSSPPIYRDSDSESDTLSLEGLRI